MASSLLRANGSPSVWVEQALQALALCCQWDHAVVLSAHFQHGLDPGICACALCGPFEQSAPGLCRDEIVWWCWRWIVASPTSVEEAEEESSDEVMTLLHHEARTATDVAILREVAADEVATAPPTLHDTEVSMEEMLTTLSRALTSYQVATVLKEYNAVVRQHFKDVRRFLGLPHPDSVRIPAVLFESRLVSPAERFDELLRLPSTWRQSPIRRKRD